MSKTNEVRLIDANSLLEDLQELLNQEVLGDTVSDVGNGIAIAMQRVIEAKGATLNDLSDAIYEDAVKHGLYALEKDVPEIERAAVSLVSMIKSETNEARDAAIDWEAHRSGAQDHFAEELADVIIMTLSACGHLGIDIDAAVRRKMEINKARPWKHEKEDQGKS